MSGSALRIIVTGMVGQYPVGGVAWDYLQYVMGLSRLGHDVYYHEDTWCWPYDPLANARTDSADYPAGFLAGFFATHAPELSDRWHYRHLHGESFGMSLSAFADIAGSADVYLNVSGAGILPDGLPESCVKVFIDTDPGYNQILLAERPPWAENIERWCENVAAHDRHFTYAENIDDEDCRVPTVGIQWSTTRMPVILDHWAALPVAADDDPWTTVLTWNTFNGPLVHEGVSYYGKGPEVEKLIDLPSRTGERLLAAVGGTEAPLERLGAFGWEVIDGPASTRTAEAYRDLIAASRGEVSAAKHVYVVMRTGWFSCRSACYLAAARPVVVQDTGFSSHLPVGAGLLAFSSPEEAAAQLAEVSGDYPRHASAARDLAVEYFDSDRVLARLLEEASTSPARGECRAPRQ